MEAAMTPQFGCKFYVKTVLNQVSLFEVLFSKLDEVCHRLGQLQIKRRGRHLSNHAEVIDRCCSIATMLADSSRWLIFMLIFLQSQGRSFPSCPRPSRSARRPLTWPAGTGSASPRSCSATAAPTARMGLTRTLAVSIPYSKHSGEISD